MAGSWHQRPADCAVPRSRRVGRRDCGRARECPPPRADFERRPCGGRASQPSSVRAVTHRSLESECGGRRDPVTTWHLLAPEYPPACGGVGDYTALVAGGLADAGDGVHVWHSGVDSALDTIRASRVAVHRLPDRFGRQSRDRIEAGIAHTPGTVLVQYVPGAFGLLGMNIPFCRWLARLHRR